MLNFKDNYFWSGKGILSDRYRNCYGLKDILNQLIREMKDAGEHFQNMVATDNKLIGQERYKLAEELEDLLGGFFYLYKFILKADSGSFRSEYTDDGHSFTVEFDDFVWRGEGKLREPGLSGSFSHWFNTVLLQKTALLIKKYGAVYADGVVNEDEKKQLCSGINDILFKILAADKGLKGGSLS